VKGLKITDWAKKKLRAQMGRKLKSDKHGLQYTLENVRDMRYRLDRVWEDDGLEAYTNIDLYWMLRHGFYVEEYVGGFGWKTTNALSTLIYGGYNMRLEAKKEGNQCLQQTLKLFLNGLFGVQSQKVIRSVEIVTSLPPELKDCGPDSPGLIAHLTSNHKKKMDSRFSVKDIVHLGNGQSLVKCSIAKELAEGLKGYSPHHMGAAVLSWSRHVMNLVMMELEPEECTYTDTDSLAIFGPTYKELCTSSSLMGNALGQYKNDYGDYFKSPGSDPIVLFSAIGAKKVKLHVVADYTGEVYISNTYKGWMGQGTDLDGRKFSFSKLAYDQSLSLLEAFYLGSPNEHLGTRWLRSCDIGVQIQHNVLFSPDSSTYLGYCKGFTNSSPPGDLDGFVSYVVPYGSHYDEDEVIIPSPSRHYVTNKILGYTMPDRWSEVIEERGIPTFERMKEFLSSYYQIEENLHYAPTSVEEKEEYQEINAIFDRNE